MLPNYKYLMLGQYALFLQEEANVVVPDWLSVNPEDFVQPGWQG